ncbi:MAG TPA: hypothetical protein VLU46_12325 [Thermoanaerobaculia bacterium]|nr:hypothetical protein [Thermoanaerobaculia bacterium]
MIAVWLVAAAFLGWFAFGSITNVRKGKRVLAWMQDGLPQLGERTTLRWLGTSAVEMAIADATKPFRQATLVIFLEPRDVPWIWLPSRARGRRDTLIVRAQLRDVPESEFEAIDAGSWSGREMRSRLEREQWPAIDREGLRVFHPTDAGVSLAGALLARARQAGMRVRRLSLRKSEPHFQLHVDLPTVSAAEFFTALRQIGESAVRT